MNALPPLSLVDIIALALIGIGGLHGFFRGFSGELAQLIGTVVAFFAGVSLHGPVGGWIQEHTRLENQSAHAVAFIATIVLSVLIMVVLRMLVKRLLKVVFEEGPDKGLGVCAGLLRMSVVVCIIFIIMNLIPHAYLNQKFGEASAIGCIVVRYIPTVRETLERADMPAPQRRKEAPASD